MTILGISCYFHDAAACLVIDGHIVAAASEERFTRIKHDANFPVHAIRYCLETAGLLIDSVDWLIFYDKPFRKFDRIVSMYLDTFPKSRKAFVQAIPAWVKKKLYMRDLFEQEIYYDGKVLFCEHHLSHAASAFFLSPFRRSALLTVDGVGEWDVASYGVGEGETIDMQKEMRFPHSIGLLYNAFTYYLGFEVNSDEYKVMGLAPYGKPRFADKIYEMIDVRTDGSFRVDLRYFGYHYGLRMINKKFISHFGAPVREPETEIRQRDCDIAASIQHVTEELLLKMARHVHSETGEKHLCLAGGVILNSVANGRIVRETPFQDVFIQPAAGDAGGAIGAALFCYHALLGHPRQNSLQHVYFGPEYDDETISLFLKNEGLAFEHLDDTALVKRTAALLEKGKIVGWFQGRMEFGPRALGNRSILADPRQQDMKDRVNQAIKFREGFRPFAPAVPYEVAGEFFHIDRPSPYMLLVVPVKESHRDRLPAITHVDGSARVQTVERQHNALFFDLLTEFGRRAGLPVLLNTSFNVRGEPIVCTPRDAVNCFFKTRLDVLVLGNHVITEKPIEYGNFISS